MGNFITQRDSNPNNLEEKTNSNIIDLNKGLETIEIIPEQLSLYLNMIGGHSFFVVYAKKYLIKSVGQKELKFYEFIISNNIDSRHLPKFFGLIEKNTKYYEYIINYKKQCDLFFRDMVKYFNIKLEDIDIENELIFHKKFNDFIDDNNNSNNNITLDKSFDLLKEELIKIKNSCPKKLFWIFFWYIKWQKEFISDKYIIIENLEFHTKIPSVIDIKIGNEKKISKETGKVKIFKGAYESLGCRIMGISSNNLYFKSRYETKELDEKKFTNELQIFFGDKKNIINSVINELKEIVKFVQDYFILKIYFCSLLIFYDHTENEKEAIVKLIDFDLTNNAKEWKNEIYFINKEKGKNIKNVANDGFINCMNNLINILLKMNN
jgi:hypothetical protein